MLGFDVRAAFLGVLVVGLASCSKPASEAPAYVFYGECSVEVVSKTSGADVQIDGISVGQVPSVKVNIPCGEKLIHIVKPGYVPYRQFLPTSLAAPLRVEVELSRLEIDPEFSQSKELLSQAERGLKPRDPWARGADGKPQGDYPKDMQAEIRVAKATGTGAAAATSGSASSGALVDDSVDNWR